MSEGQSILQEKKIKDLLRINRIDDISKIGDLPIIALKGITPNINKIIINTLKIHKIKELAEISLTDKKRSELEKEGISSDKLEKWIIAAKLLLSSEIPDTEKQTQKGKKIAFVGLENAGKTAIIQMITKKSTIDTMSNLEPTIKIDRQSTILEDIRLVIWDFGGQKDYRNHYINNPKRYFLELNVFVFVIDIQDSNKFDEVLNYLRKLLEIFDYLKECPEIIILLHKADPDIINTEPIINSINLIQSRIVEIMGSKSYSIYTTSIYNAIPQSDDFIEAIKEIASSRKNTAQESKITIEDLVCSIDRALTVLIKLSVYIEEKFEEMNTRLTNLEDFALSALEKLLDLEKVHDKQQTIDKIQDELVEKRQSMQKDAIHNELKKIFTN
ncbi:MAG: ADP-ribosylation factor-like protein [Candidatus Helarchaeota archaeon]